MILVMAVGYAVSYLIVILTALLAVAVATFVRQRILELVRLEIL